MGTEVVALLFMSFAPLGISLFFLLIPFSNYSLEKFISVAFSVFLLILSFYFYFIFDVYSYQLQCYVPIFDIAWLNSVYALAIDGLSFWFIVLTNFLVFISLIYVNKSILYRNYFFSVLFFIQFFILQSFLVTDIFIFYLFFEAILIPMFLMIGIWGSYNRNLHASFLFFLYTLFGSLLMLLGIIFLQLEVGSTEFVSLSYYSLSFESQLFIFMSFFISFGIKVPMVPVHIWLPEAHGEAPTIGSVILAGILLKLGLYGILRVVIPCCPDAIYFFRDYIYVLGILAVTYTALVTLAQTDLKRIVAYSSVGHMNLSLLGLFTMTVQGFSGSVFSLISHGLISSGLFICVGILYDRYGTKLISYYGSFVHIMPLFATCFFLLTFANVAFPGSSAFVGEFLIFLGLVSTNFVLFLFASLSVIFVALYSVWTYNRVMFGPNFFIASLVNFSDLTMEELLSLIFLLVFILLLGVFPELILSTLNLVLLKFSVLY